MLRLESTYWYEYSCDHSHTVPRYGCTPVDTLVRPYVRRIRLLRLRSQPAARKPGGSSSFLGHHGEELLFRPPTRNGHSEQAHHPAGGATAVSRRPNLCEGDAPRI
jgi:hypothetical protein